VRDQVPFQQSNLSRFTGTVTAFKSDETNHESESLQTVCRACTFVARPCGGRNG
jgi:hypothetical protein